MLMATLFRRLRGNYSEKKLNGSKQAIPNKHRHYYDKDVANERKLVKLSTWGQLPVQNDHTLHPRCR